MYGLPWDVLVQVLDKAKEGAGNSKHTFSSLDAYDRLHLYRDKLSMHGKRHGHAAIILPFFQGMKRGFPAQNIVGTM